MNTYPHPSISPHPPIVLDILKRVQATRDAGLVTSEPKRAVKLRGLAPLRRRIARSTISLVRRRAG